MHSKKASVKRCEKPEVPSPLLEATVFEMVEQTMLDATTLRPCLDQVNETRQAAERRPQPTTGTSGLRSIDGAGRPRSGHKSCQT